MEFLFLASLGSVFSTLLTIVYLLVCLLLIFVILIQKGSEGSGLGGAFGGGGDTAFGVKANLAFKKTTGVIAGIFIFLSLLLAYVGKPSAPEIPLTPEAPATPGVVAPPAPSNSGLGLPERELPPPSPQ